MKKSEKIKMILALIIAFAYGVTVPYIFYTYREYHIIKLIVSMILILYILHKLVKDEDNYSIVLKVFKISSFIGIVIALIYKYYI